LGHNYRHILIFTCPAIACSSLRSLTCDCTSSVHVCCHRNSKLCYYCITEVRLHSLSVISVDPLSSMATALYDTHPVTNIEFAVSPKRISIIAPVVNNVYLQIYLFLCQKPVTKVVFCYNEVVSGIPLREHAY